MFYKTKSIRSAVLLILIVQSAVIFAGNEKQNQGPYDSKSIPSIEKVVHSVTGIKGRELTGALSQPDVNKRNSKLQKRKGIQNIGLSELGLSYIPSPYKNQSVIDGALSNKISAAKINGKDYRADDDLRLIVYLSYHPHAQIFRESTHHFQSEINALEIKRKNLLSESAAKRDLEAQTDALNYPSMLLFDDGYKAEMRALTEEHEALSLLINKKAVTQIKGMVKSFQEPIVNQLTAMGIKVEFGAVVGNLLVIKSPLNQVEFIATIPGVIRIAEDELMESHLNNLPSATMVDPADTTLVGLWDTGLTGGIYDPAIIDSGLDDNHPAMTNSVTPLRDNFQSWYLVAANGSASFDDQFTTDDLQGHGTAVAGIVGSKGSSGFTNLIGVSHGVEKLVNLKAGWLNTSGTASMFWSDMYMLVDRGLNDTSALSPSDFNDDIDGINISYGGSTTLDDTDGGRFLDSVIDSYSDLPITISAGNSGPSNTNFSNLASAYNIITVGNADDRNTVTRNDDIMRSSSTQGPTASGRKKPDISTYGTSIGSPNDNWEGAGADYINFTGTSASAPVVLGVIMDLNDAGVFDELAVKALLINTAQKNLPGISIENDSDGWDEQVGWGVLNAYAAFFHRFDTFKDSVAPRDTDGEFQLYKGSMRDEGIAGEGRDRATLTWNRSATYDAGVAPSEYFTLSDLNLRLYSELNNTLIDNDLTASDNVHQVRIGAGAGDTDVVVKVYAWSTSFANGDGTQEYALATEDGFTRVDFPRTFQGIALWPTEVEPNEVFDIEFWLRNDSEVASHNNVFNLELPAGFTLLSGIDTQNVGSAAVGENTSMVTYTIRAPAVAGAGQNIQVKHSHSSYLEEYGDFNWNMGIDVLVDNTPPNPNPMTFSVAPFNSNLNELSMTAQFASDLHNPVEYFLEYMNSPSGGGGWTQSGWVSNRAYVDTGLGNNHEYCYRAWARDNASSPNNTTPSPIACAYTSQGVPEVSVNSVTTSSVAVNASSLPSNINLDSSGIQFQNIDEATSSSWQQDNSPWDSTGLTPAMTYDFVAKARNGDGDETAASAVFSISTLANPPAVNSFAMISDSQIQVNLNANGNGSSAEYLIQNVTSGNDSGWINSLTWLENGLSCSTPYTYQAKARNPDGVETIIVNIGVAVNDCSSDIIFVDGFDN